ncbi:uncharacterized protein LOC132941651 [Metopolophium dirhodum]|uniref:uncharacterized protein LOC132941422 n=1 Tax=Metopolophium dirhodum TaxID=44670 RepID=UPI00298FA406|nr:uncharacterized protein LOC132941422 [Metopolophium dirhodum]XP_060865778.1 uncharacterized protein LOC132941651 [Metopolophium dirhodum]
MGGRRGKRNRTPPVTEPKKLRNGTYSPPPLLVATSQRQRAEPPSPDQSDSESLSGESYASSVNSRPTSDISETDRQMASVSAPSSTLSSGDNDPDDPVPLTHCSHTVEESEKVRVKYCT